MKPHRRDKLDRRIGRALKAGFLAERAPLASRYRLLHSAANGANARAMTSTRRGWSSAFSERTRAHQRQAVEGRKYGYLVVTAAFRLAW